MLKELKKVLISGKFLNDHITTISTAALSPFSSRKKHIVCYNLYHLIEQKKNKKELGSSSNNNDGISSGGDSIQTCVTHSSARSTCTRIRNEDDDNRVFNSPDVAGFAGVAGTGAGVANDRCNRAKRHLNRQISEDCWRIKDEHNKEIEERNKHLER